MWKLAYICWLEMGIGCQLGRRVWFGGGMVPFAVPCMALDAIRLSYPIVSYFERFCLLLSCILFYPNKCRHDYCENKGHHRKNKE